MLLLQILKWAVRGVLALVVAFALLYLGDWAVFAMRGAPRGTVTVQSTAVVPLKGNKREYVDQGLAQLACAKALFGQNGMDPCWQLQRRPEQQVNY